jgi:hypothetical protein
MKNPFGRPPNPRVQRTRPYASLRGSPLTRHPLGGFSDRERIRLRHLLALSVLAFVGGCNDTRNMLTIATPAEVLSFQIERKDKLVIWRIEADSPQALHVLRYGLVPLGFRQVTPAAPSAPPPLKEGEELTTTTVEPSRTFTHRCKAVGTDRITCGYWQSAPFKRPTPEARSE